MKNLKGIFRNLVISTFLVTGFLISVAGLTLFLVKTDHFFNLIVPDTFAINFGPPSAPVCDAWTDVAPFRFVEEGAKDARLWQITNNGPINSTLQWAVTSNRSWLSVDPSSGSITVTGFVPPLQNPYIKIDPAGLTLGNYTGTLTLSDNGSNPAATGCPITVPISLTIFPPSGHLALTVKKTGSGAAASTVTSFSPGKINCGNKCAASYASGEREVLKVKPAPGFIITSQVGCDDLIQSTTFGDEWNCVVDIFNDTIVGINFGPPSEGGMPAANWTLSVNAGLPFVVTYNPQEGLVYYQTLYTGQLSHTIDPWLIFGISNTSDVPLSYTITADQSWLRPDFGGGASKVTITSPPGSGQNFLLRVNPAGLVTGEYPANLVITGKFVGSPLKLPVMLTVSGVDSNATGGISAGCVDIDNDKQITEIDCGDNQNDNCSAPLCGGGNPDNPPVDKEVLPGSGDEFNPPRQETSVTSSPFSWQITNPFAGGVDSVMGLLAVLANFIFQLGIPVAVIIIIYSGVTYLTAGNTERVKRATHGLKYAALGLAILLIGKGFVALIQSILSIR